MDVSINVILRPGAFDDRIRLMIAFGNNRDWELTFPAEYPDKIAIARPYQIKRKHLPIAEAAASLAFDMIQVAIQLLKSNVSEASIECKGAAHQIRIENRVKVEVTVESQVIFKSDSCTIQDLINVSAKLPGT
jgi:hypothetical protein